MCGTKNIAMDKRGAKPNSRQGRHVITLAKAGIQLAYIASLDTRLRRSDGQV